MNVQQRALPGFMVSIRPVPDQPHAYSVNYVPRGLQRSRSPNGKAKRAPEYKALIDVRGEEIAISWQKRPSLPEVTSEELDDDVRYRIRLMREWLSLISQLIDTVGEWATDSDWSTRVVEKPMEDSEIGNFKAPALLLQQEVTKVLLEPIARQGAGAEGLVDLYLMPGYDDIASLYYYNDRWNLHYQVPAQPLDANLRKAKAKPLTKANFVRVLGEMRRHAQ